MQCFFIAFVSTLKNNLCIKYSLFTIHHVKEIFFQFYELLLVVKGTTLYFLFFVNEFELVCHCFNGDTKSLICLNLHFRINPYF
jgi:hypothetical protein